MSTRIDYGELTLAIGKIGGWTEHACAGALHTTMQRVHIANTKHDRVSASLSCSRTSAGNDDRSALEFQLRSVISNS